MSEYLIEARGLRREFGRIVAVEDVSLKVGAGEIYGFLGPNGAGKTTMIRMLAGLLSPTAGEVRIGGLDYGSAGREIRSICGFAPDTPPLYEILTARQFAAFVAELYGRRDADFDARLAQLFANLELSDRADDLLRGFSHGMKKKAHLAALLATRPRVLFLDEPTNGLDPRSARHLKDLLVEFARDGACVFLSTHLLETAEELCQRIGILFRGRLRAEGTIAELREEYGGSSLEEIFLRITDDRGVTAGEDGDGRPPSA